MYSSEEKEARYGLTILSKGNAVAGHYIEVEYENPLGGQPLSSNHLVNPGGKEFVLQSPPVQGLKAYRNYEVTVYLYENDRKTKLICTHIQGLQNLINQADLGW